MTVTTINPQWIFEYNPEGPVTPDVFRWNEDAVPVPKPGEVLVRNRVLSLDPANRAWMRGRTFREQVLPGQVMHGFTISEVVSSSVADFAPGDIVETMGGWQQFAALPAKQLTRRDGSVALEHLVGVYSITGLTAYFGMFDVGQVRPGDTVLISAAAGAVGSIAGQLARIAGARVVGIAGGPEKCAWLTDTLHFDAAVDYKAGDVAAAIRAACPDGVDLYFDNVGGQILDFALRAMNQNGRIVCCGAVANYDIGDQPFVSPLLPGVLVGKRLRMEGFIVLDYLAKRSVAEARLRQWLASGALIATTEVRDGLATAPDALIHLLQGGNRGKMAVRLT